jgi:tripartite-type tricarboxylate transporter receptor subunit TctC
MKRTARASFVAILCAAFTAAAMAAEHYPERPIRLIAPYPPGGGVDLNARILADLLGPVLGQTILVDNRPGAGSRLGTELVSKAPPDGYTLGLSAIDMAIAAALYDNLPYDTLRDFVPISLLTEQPNILVAHPSLAAKSLQEFIALARARPGKLTYSTSGIGTGPHLATELLALSQKVELLHVPYKGTGPALTGLLGNEVSVSLATFASALPLVKSERLRALAVTTRMRAKALPAVPTVAESAVPATNSAPGTVSSRRHEYRARLSNASAAPASPCSARPRHGSATNRKGSNPFRPPRPTTVPTSGRKSRSGRRWCARRTFPCNKTSCRGRDHGRGPEPII